MCVWAAVRFSRELPDLTSLIVTIFAAAVVVDVVAEARSIDERTGGWTDGWMDGDGIGNCGVDFGMN